MVRRTLESLTEASYASLDCLAAAINNNIQGLGHIQALGNVTPEVAGDCVAIWSP